MRSAIELAQDSILPSASSTNPAVPAFSIPQLVSRSSVCSEPNLIADGIVAGALLVDIAGGLGKRSALVHDTASHITGTGGRAQAAARVLMVADPAAMAGDRLWSRGTTSASAAAGDRPSKYAMREVRAPLTPAAASMT